MRLKIESYRKTRLGLKSHNGKLTVDLPAGHPYLLLFRYLLVGATAAIVDWIFYWLFINAFLLHYIVAATFSFILATSVNYVLSKKWAFRNIGKFGRLTEFSLVFLVSAVGLLINQVALFVLIELFTLHYMLSKIAATGIVFFWNFSLRKNYIFKN